jgi:hypothetical protein
MTPRRKRRIWIDGPDPGVMVVDVDPPLAPEEVEIDFDDPAISRTTTPRMSAVDLVALLDLSRSR